METKYYTFNGQRIAQRVNDRVTYLHGDHPSASLRARLGSTLLATISSGLFQAEQGYRAYGRYRRGGALPTDHRFTGQKLDGTGLMYYNARYYDPEIGQFISPDTLVPNSTHVFDYNRYLYAQGNPMRYTDPTGHCASAILMLPWLVSWHRQQKTLIMTIRRLTYSVQYGIMTA